MSICCGVPFTYVRPFTFGYSTWRGASVLLHYFVLHIHVCKGFPAIMFFQTKDLGYEYVIPWFAFYQSLSANSENTKKLFKGPFIWCDSVCDNVIFFLKQVMGSMAANESVHTDTCTSDIYCDTDFNAEIIFDAIADVPCE